MNSASKIDLLHLWHRVVNGEGAAFDAIFSDMVHSLNAHGNQMGVDAYTIDEAIQITFIDLWKYRKSIKISYSFEHYLFKVFRRNVFKVLEASKSKNLVFSVEVEQSIEDQIIEQENRSRGAKTFKQVLQHVSPRQKEALFLKFHENLTNQEIADVLSIDIKGVYKLISTALIRLKRRSQKKDFIIG